MNFGGTVRISRSGMLLLFGICALILIYYVATNHKVKGSLANTLKQQLPFNKQGTPGVGSGTSLPLPLIPAGRRQDTTVDLRHLLAVAIEVAERGGNEVRQVRKDADMQVASKGRTREGVEDPLTEGDLRSHYQMYFGLKRVFPGLKVVSEEHMHRGKGTADVLPIVGQNPEVDAAALPELDPPVDLRDVTVWIDPLDATKEYTEKLLEYVTTMVCVAVRGKPVIGVIHQPFKENGVTYWAWVDHGQSKTLQLQQPPAKLPKPLKVLVSMSHAGETEKFAKKAFGEVKMVPAAGAGFKTLSLLDGRGDVYVHTTLIKKWDTCAPDALLRATGGRLTTLRGEPIDYAASEADKREKVEHGLLAAAALHGPLLEQVRRAEGR